MQTFTNCIHSYDCAQNKHANGVALTQKFLHCIDSSTQKQFESANLLERQLFML